MRGQVLVYGFRVAHSGVVASLGFGFLYLIIRFRLGFVDSGCHGLIGGYLAQSSVLSRYGPAPTLNGSILIAN